MWLLLMGLVIGSFLNVVIARLPEGLSIVRPRSRCPKCGHTLSWYENIPVLSWIVLRGRCRGCRSPISIRYPLIELLTGVLFMLCLRRFDWTPELLSALIFVTLLIPLTFIDLEHYLLPHALTLPGIVLGVASAALNGGRAVLTHAIGAAIGFGTFLLFEFIGEKIFKKEALGGGDKFLLAMIGAFLGYRPLLAVIFLSSLQGSIIGIISLLVSGRAGPELPATKAEGQNEVPPETRASGSPNQTRVAAEAAAPDPAEEDDNWTPAPNSLPFGPYLALAAVEVLLLGPTIQAWLPYPLGNLFDGGG